jgi:hypothetical protein
MANKRSIHFIQATRDFIFSISTKQRFRVDKTHFTRNRKLPFEHLALCMLKLLRKSLVLELSSFFAEIGSSFKRISPSAFVQGRKKIKPDMFEELNQLIVSEYYSDNEENVRLFENMRILSVDGSTVNLPLTKDLLKYFELHNNQNKTNDVLIGRVSVLYDVLNNIVIDGLLRPFSQGEVTLCREHLKYVKNKDLVIMDRAYPSFDTAWELNKKEAHYLFRCKVGFSKQVAAFYESGAKDKIVEIKPKQKKSFKGLAYGQEASLKARMLSVKLDSGETEILMTSLLDGEKYPQQIFKDLYFKRWGVETYYDRFKNIIEVEKFSGTSRQFIQQEFNCALYLSNMQTILTIEANKEAAQKYVGRKYEYKVNQSLALGFIRKNLVEIFSSEQKSEELLEELKKMFVENVIPIRPGRKNKRNVDKFRQRTKPKQFKNRRDIL